MSGDAALPGSSIGVVLAHATFVRKSAVMSVNGSLDGANLAVYSGPAGRAALNDLRGWPLPSLEAI